jgi:excisionase family DNA binding protein
MSQEPTGVNRVLYTAAEVAEMLSVHREVVYRLCAAGDLESVIVGGHRRRRIFASSVDAYLARLAEGGAA